MERKHTPTPWHQTDNEHPRAIGFIYAADKYMVADTYGMRHPAKENAKFIVRACNAHYDLIEGLLIAKNLIEIVFDRTPVALQRFSGDWVAIEQKLNAALAKAKGDQ